MLIDKLRQWQYYYKKLPLYMRNSYGIPEHFELLYEVMMQLEQAQDNVIDAFNLLQDDYVNKVIAKYDDVNGYDFKLLDIIGSLYGVNRSLNISYYNQTARQHVTKALYLSNKEFYTFIKSRIIQNNYDGTFEQSRQYYTSIGLPLYMFTTFDDNENATCYMYLGRNENTSDNIRDLFLANLLTLKSVGITYVVNEIDIYHMAVWADNNVAPNNNNSWDVSIWL